MDLLWATLLLFSGLACASRENPKVRLSGGSNPCSGFVQVLHNDRWGYVCESNWNKKNTHVICKEIGCGDAAEAPKDTIREAEGTFWLDEVTCTGQESSLLECEHDGFGNHKCVPQQEVSVTCSEDIHLQLSGGRSSCAGRVEVYAQDSWGAVCGDDWDPDDARVVCRELECGEPVTDSENMYFGPPLSTVQMHSLKCIGNETHLWQCGHSSNQQTCGPAGSAQVICSEHKEWRLSGRMRACSGELKIGDSVSSVCLDRWKDEYAEGVCMELGCGNLRSTSPKLKNVSLLHNPLTPVEYAREEALDTTCVSKEVLHIECSGNVTVRLSHGCAGIVEVFHSGSWGKVCNRGNEWKRKNAEMVCQETGCGDFAFFPTISHEVTSSLDFTMSDVSCTDEDIFLGQCGFSQHTDNCWKDVRLACSKSMNVSLVDGGSRCAGRLEVKYLGKSGTVCRDGWGMVDADTVCQELNCGMAADTQIHFGQGTGEILLTKVDCTREHHSLWQCGKIFETQSCQHSRDVGIICQGHLALRLRGHRPCSGLVEVGHMDVAERTWRPVEANQEWDENAANVVCHQMHCGHAVARYERTLRHVPGFTFHCQGNETSLMECKMSDAARPTTSRMTVSTAEIQPAEESSTTKYPADYESEEDAPVRTISHAGVNCSEEPLVKLQGGNDNCSGRVEIAYEGEWGAICDTNWDHKAASLVCQELHCGSVLESKPKGLRNVGVPFAWLDFVQCQDDTQFLWHCSPRPQKTQQCHAGSYAEVICSESVQLRLANGPSRCAGMVEVFFKYSWKKVCSSTISQKFGSYVCNELKCGMQIDMPQGEMATSGRNAWIRSFFCKSGEFDKDCLPEEILESDCREGKALALICSGHQQLYLKGSGNPCSGQVQIHHYKDQWKYMAIPEEGFTSSTANVVCQQLHCGKAVSFNTTSFQHVNPWGTIYNCTGNEASLWDCPEFSKSNVGGAVTVNCSENIEVKLSSPYRCSGLVELKYQNGWSNVCSQHWNDRNGFGVKMCSVLGCNRFLGSRNVEITSSNDMSVNYLHCGESSLHPWQCLTAAPENKSCPTGQAISVVCSGSLEFRLKGGHSRCDGSVEIFYDGIWGAVCNQTWNKKTADLVCQANKCGFSQLLYHTSITEKSQAPAVLTQIECDNQHAKLWHCRGNWGIHDSCPIGTAASVVCSDGVDPETMKISIPKLLSAVLVPLLLLSLLALGIVMRRLSMSAKKRSFLKKNSEKIYDEIPGDNVDSGAKDGQAMIRLNSKGEMARAPSQTDSQQKMNDDAESDPEEERYDDAELIIPLASVTGALKQDSPDVGTDPAHQPIADIEAGAPEKTQKDFHVIVLDP
ncbi:scavenger receptor cysteine-rich type 1 protein M130-like [Ambystoma mexicanum]|uniref:scavenger receptor cysteine-rich type 1 protein M130-like n=1 Tax=Ambystoma mexicanum TaxID=8296 RepID=UPI0037E9911C